MPRPLRLVVTVIAAAAFTALATAPAVTARLTLDGADLTRGIAAAKAVWGSLPCDGRIALRWEDDDPEVNATSYWTAAEPTYRDCVIAFNPRADWDGEKLCTVFVHELGHLHGHGHTGATGELMSVYYSRPIAACRVHGPPSTGGPNDGGRPAGALRQTAVSVERGAT